MEEIIYRRGEEKDLPRIIEILKDFGLNLFGINYKGFIIAEINSHIIGFAQIKEMSDGSLQLASVAVLEKYQKNGIASNIIKKLLANDLRRPVYLMCRKERQNFYKKFGFEQIRTRDYPAAIKKEWDIAEIAHPNIEGAAMRLGGVFPEAETAFYAKAISGSGQGKRIGFPTINLDQTDIKPWLMHGVYLATARINKKNYQCLLFFGEKQTFGGGLSLEIFIKDFISDVKGREIKVLVIKKIRDVKKFANFQELQEQIKLDIKNNL